MTSSQPVVEPPPHTFLVRSEFNSGVEVQMSEHRIDIFTMKQLKNEVMLLEYSSLDLALSY